MQIMESRRRKRRKTSDWLRPMEWRQKCMTRTAHPKNNYNNNQSLNKWANKSHRIATVVISCRRSFSCRPIFGHFISTCHHRPYHMNWLSHLSSSSSSFENIKCPVVCTAHTESHRKFLFGIYRESFEANVNAMRIPKAKRQTIVRDTKQTTREKLFAGHLWAATGAG